MHCSFNRLLRLWMVLPLASLAVVFSACGSGGGSGSGAEVTGLMNNVAVGPVSDAAVSVYTLEGSKLAETHTAVYDAAVDLTDNKTTLVGFDQQQVGKFTVTLPSDFDGYTLLLVKVEGGVDIDPDDDGNISTGAFKTLNGSLYAYATATDLANGRVTVNAFTTLASEFAQGQGLKDQSEIESLLTNLSKLLFKTGDADTPLNRFNPARLDSEGKMEDLQMLADVSVYAAVLGSETIQDSYSGADPLYTDTDKEGLFDDLELMIGSNPDSKNTDGDALNDYGELFAGTNPLVSDTSEYSDILYPYQWHLDNTGQAAGSATGGVPGEDIGIGSLWTAYAGSRSVLVGIVDTGVDATHPDLVSNLDRSKSIRYSDGSDDPSPNAQQLSDAPYESTHGTACAGLVAARGWNDIGTRGVAPFTKVAGFNVFSSPSESNFLDALSQEVDISSNSWGYGSETLVSDPAMIDVLKTRAKQGREGKGTVFVIAAGNDRDIYVEDANGRKCYIGNANNADVLNNAYVITVAAVTADGHYASYSNFGANILVSAPGGEYGIDVPAIVTTDLTGLQYGFDSTGFADNYRDGIRFDVPGNENGNYTNYMNGTSAATPIVSGAAALMLEANPALTYRDVRYILATTARKNDPNDSEWTTNGAGYHINQNYGFGVVNAEAAVAKSEAFTHLAPSVTTAKQTVNPNLAVPDNNPAGVVSTIAVSSAITVEHVDVWVSIPDHAFPGDLDISLVSPAGTVSRLAYGGNYYVVGNAVDPLTQASLGYQNWRFSTERCLDETSVGTWTLKVKDLHPLDTGTLTSWSLQITGR